MNVLPNLSGVATSDLVDQIGGTGFQAKYINWARTMQLLRDNAPGWLPELVSVDNTSVVLHRSPVGGYLMIRFRHVDGHLTSSVPQAIMDSKNNAVPYEKITARDVTDTHVRGVCKAAAFTFGLAYELWAKLPLENGYGEEPEIKADPKEGNRLQDFATDRQMDIQEWAKDITKEWRGNDHSGAAAYWGKSSELPMEERACVWGLLDSDIRSGIKKLLIGETK